MLQRYYPYEYAKSVRSIDYDKLYALGYRGLMFDIDNTLVHHGDPSTEQVDAFLADLQERGFKVVLLSDNDEERISAFVANSKVPFVADAKKPSSKGYKKALRILGLKADEVIMVGDQVFTDIRGANKAGVASILVHYITASGQRVGKKRYVEKAIMFAFRHNKRNQKRLGAIELE